MDIFQNYRRTTLALSPCQRKQERKREAREAAERRVEEKKAQAAQQAIQTQQQQEQRRSEEKRLLEKQQEGKRLFELRAAEQHICETPLAEEMVGQKARETRALDIDPFEKKKSTTGCCIIDQG